MFSLHGLIILTMPASLSFCASLMMTIMRHHHQLRQQMLRIFIYATLSTPTPVILAAWSPLSNLFCSFSPSYQTNHSSINWKFITSHKYLFSLSAVHVTSFWKSILTICFELWGNNCSVYWFLLNSTMLPRCLGLQQIQKMAGKYVTEG